jgi:hypothetical protein
MYILTGHLCLQIRTKLRLEYYILGEYIVFYRLQCKVGEEGSGRNHSISSGVLIYEALIPLYEFGMAL